MNKKKYNILFIGCDDECTYQKIINLAGYNFIHAYNAVEGDKLIRESDPSIDLILINLESAERKSSFEYAEKILEQADLPLIFITEDINENLIKQAEDITPYGCMSKGTAEAGLKQYIEITLKLHRSLLKKKDSTPETENKYRTVFENVHTAIIVIEENTVISLANTQFAYLSGYTREEIEGEKSWTEFVVKEDVDRMIEQHYLRRSSPGLALDQYEFRFITRYSKMIDMLVTVHLIPGTGRSIASFMDISVLKNAEERLRDSESKYRELVQNANSIILRMDSHGNITFFNEFAQKYFGFSEDEILSKNVVGTIVPEFDSNDRDLRQIVTDLCMNPDNYAFHENENIKKNGERVWISWTNKPILDNNNNLTGVLSIGSDVTVRRRAEQALVESERRLSDIVQFFPDAIFVIDCEGKITAWNKAMEEMTGVRTDKMLGRGDHEYSIPFYGIRRPALIDIALQQQDDYKVNYSNFRRTGNIISGEAYIPNMMGEQKYLFATAAVLYNSQGEITGAIEAIRDITQRRKTELALQESERRLSDVIQFFPDPILIIDNNGITTAWNKALENLTGVKAEDIIGKGNYEYSIPFYGERRPVLIDQVLTNDDVIREKYSKINYKLSVLSSEGYVNSLPGGIKYLTGSATALYNSRDEIIGAIEVLKDITERKITELALQESERRLSDIIQFFPDAILVIDRDGNITAWNKAMEEMTGAKAEDMIGKGNYEYSLPFYGERRPILIDLAMKTDKKTEIKYVDFERSGTLITGEAYMPNLRGGQAYLFGTATALYNSQGELVGAIESIRDITERKKAEEMLIMEKERLAITLKSIGDGVIVADTSGSILLINKAAENLLGWTQSEIVNLPLMDYFHIVDAGTRIRNKDLLQKVIETGNVIELAGKIILINKEGREYIISESAAPVRDKDNNMIGIIIVFRDMTEKQKMEDELLKTQKLESIGIIAGGIAHDFNNILTGIIGYISLARMLVRPEDRIYNMLTEMEKASLRATNLTQQLLTFSRGWAPIRKTVFISELIKEGAAFVLSGSNIKCDFFIQDDLWPVEIDEGQIIQVINNLLINARQAMPDGGAVEIKAENIDVDFMKNIPLKGGRYQLISIKDQGTGIPEEIQSKIFDPFFTTRVTGNGLGLSTSYSIIRKHNGYITLKSKQGEGTTFYIYLPASDKQVGKSSTPVDIQESRFKGRVLLMDDEEIIRRTATEMLNYFGLEVDSAGEGDEACEMFLKAIESGNPYNLVIMDLTIPGGLGGKDTVKKFCDIDPDIKVIVSSGYSNDPILSDYKKYGFSGIVVKPYKMDDLYNQLKKFLN